MEREILLKKFKKFSSEQLAKKANSAKSTKFEKEIANELLEKRNSIIGVKSVKNKPEVEGKVQKEEEKPEVIVFKEKSGISEETKKEISEKVEHNEESNFYPKGVRVEFKSNTRSKGKGEILQGLIMKHNFKDGLSYYHIRVGMDIYHKRTTLVNKID